MIMIKCKCVLVLYTFLSLRIAGF